MNAFVESFHLLRPWALLLTMPALALWWLGRRAADTTRRWASVMDPDLLKLLVVGVTRAAVSDRMISCCWGGWQRRSRSPALPGGANDLLSPIYFLQ